MINHENGMMMFDSIIISPHMQLETFLDSIKQDDIISQHNSNYIDLFIKPQKGGEHFFLLRLFFERKSEKLEYVQLVIQNDDSIPSWTDWSEKKQLKKKKYNDLWLMKNMGHPPYNYIWGSLNSVYNEKEASSYILIKFN